MTREGWMIDVVGRRMGMGGKSWGFGWVRIERGERGLVRAGRDSAPAPGSGWGWTPQTHTSGLWRCTHKNQSPNSLSRTTQEQQQQRCYTLSLSSLLLFSLKVSKFTSTI